jgi:hypothetical protein
LFYRTLNGADVGDLFMSLIHTCQLCGANSFDYMTELQRHAHKLATKPAEWMPWNYRDLAHARQNGKRLGRPATAALHASEIGKLYRAGVSKSEIARRLEIGRTSVRRVLGPKR